MFDEFREDGLVPLHTSSSSQEVSTSPWVNWGPSVAGDATPCFKGGFLFRIIDQQKKVWALYNDTFVYEMHATFVFGPGSSVQPIAAASSSTSRRPSNGSVEETNRLTVSTGDCELTISLVVYPMETVIFARGDKSRYRCYFDGKPLSKEYILRESGLADAELAKEAAALQAAVGASPSRPWAGASSSEEETLRLCKLRRVRFIDPSFPPSQASLDGGRGLIASSGWRRPESYLPPSLRSQVRLFRRPASPSATQRGELGDSWVMSAMAMLAEHPDAIKDMFRHPVSPAETPKEEAVGACRVWLNRDGLWTSVIVDTYLPVIGKQQRYARSMHDPCEMWVSYLEKAYAKRCHSYRSIAGGDPLFAIRDFTGFPTSRLDARFRECVHDPVKSDAFFQRIVLDYENGHVVLLSTPGNSDPRSGHCSYKDKGIFVGYAYVVLDARVLEPRTPKRRKAAPLRLLRLRNAWESATKWKGRWSADSPLWLEHPEASAAFPQHGGTDGTFIVEWAEALDTFVGCGLIFNHFGYVDYRIPFCFCNNIPDVCLEVHVTEPTSLTFILSQPDTKGTPRETEDYAPTMLSIATVSSATTTTTPVSQDTASARSSRSSARSIMTSSAHVVAREYTLLVNSSADVEAPSKSFTFLQARDVGVMHTFTPEQSPYLIVPRLLGQQQHGAHSKTTAASANGHHGTETRPCVLGVLSQLAFTPFGQAHVRLCRLPAENPVFDNYLSFANDTETIEKTFYVKRSGSGAVAQKACELNA